LKSSASLKGAVEVAVADRTAADLSSPRARVLMDGVYWIGATRWAAQVVSWLSTLVVIRLLSPLDYGIAGMAVTWITIAITVAELGVGAAVVALPSLSDNQASQLHTLSWLSGVIFALVSVAAAPLVVRFYDEPALLRVLLILSLMFVAEAGRIVPLSLLARQLKYRTVAQYQLMKSLITTTIVISIALAGGGYWALIVGWLGASVAVTVWVSIFHRLPIRWPRASQIRQPLRYARDLLVSRVALTVYFAADSVVIGRFLGAQSLGIYTVARTVADLPGEKLGNVLTAASGPFFASLQSDRLAVRHYFIRISEIMAIVIMPLLIGMLLLADAAVPLLLGHQWTASVLPMQILLAHALLHTLTTPVQQVVVATGATHVARSAALIGLGVMVPGLLVGVSLGGVSGVATAWLLLFPARTVLPLATALRRLDMGFWEYLASWRSAAEGVAVMSAIVLVMQNVVLLKLPPEYSVTRLALLVVAGAFAYVATVSVRNRAAVDRLSRTVLRRA
jgi:teichuronic acid exporter